MIKSGSRFSFGTEWVVKNEMAKPGGHGRLLDDPLIVGNNRNPIYGLQTEPISTLRNAVHFCQAIVPELKDINLLMAVDQAIEAMTDDISALERAPLSIDQAASIYFYTMETPFYSVLNGAMRSENRDAIKPFFKFCKLFLSALYLVPLSAAAITVPRRESLLD